MTQLAMDSKNKLNIFSSSCVKYIKLKKTKISLVNNNYKNSYIEQYK
jgi:hypothetical protein